MLMANMLDDIHQQWRSIITQALLSVDLSYLKILQTTNNWLPGNKSLFAAFTQPLSSVKYILLGESPYPRATSANGYAFWDQSVDNLWSASGMSREVNRATSLRNLIKMLLHARGDLINDYSQVAISSLDKTNLVQTATQLFTNFMNRGFLLLNASLVYSEDQVPFHARHWRAFMQSLLSQLADYNPNLKLILFGRIAEKIPEAHRFITIKAEHPYNLSFITNPEVLNFFHPLDVLSKHAHTHND